MKYLIAIGAVILALLGLVVGVGHWETQIEQRGWDRHEAEDVIANAAIARQRRDRQQEALNEHQRNEAAAARDRAALAGNVASLQKRLAAVLGGHGTGFNTGSASCGQTVATLGNVFGNCVERYAAMGDAADADHRAGALCEALYDSLKAKQSKPVTSIRANLRDALKGNKP